MNKTDQKKAIRYITIHQFQYTHRKFIAFSIHFIISMCVCVCARERILFDFFLYSFIRFRVVKEIDVLWFQFRTLPF